jgi:protein-S-isoprenylcysteine O-methyltransferase Ste14
MDSFHWLLILVWVVYYAIHSILASTRVKKMAIKSLGKLNRYYRLFYSAFATITLAGVLYFQYSFESPHFAIPSFFKYTSLILLILPGMAIMFIAIKKYFMLLSGIRSIFVPVPPSGLKLGGIHHFVRHPLYSGTILFVWGLFIVFPFLNNLIAVILLTAYVLVGISFEEKKLIKEFGSIYQKYMLKVPMLIPDFKKEKE